MKLKGLMADPWVPVFAQVSLKNSTVEIKDLNGANSISVTIGEGNLTYNEARTMEYILDRGNLDEVREGDDIPMDVSFDFKWEYITGTSAGGTTNLVPTVEDALKKVGPAAAWSSSDTDACRPFAVDIVVTYVPDCSTGQTEQITLPDFRYEGLDHDLSAGTVACTGKCNATKATTSRYDTT